MMTTPLDPRLALSGLILAGGRGQRMGQRDKGWIKLCGRPLIEHCTKALQPQVKLLYISANRHLDRYRQLGFAVVSDEIGDFAGPLAGVEAALAQIETEYLLIAPCDSPFVVPDYALRLWRALHQRQGNVAVAHDGDRLQPVFALLARSLRPSLRQYLAAGGHKVQQWYRANAMVEVDFSDTPQMFFNINTPDDLRRAEQLATAKRL